MLHRYHLDLLYRALYLSLYESIATVVGRIYYLCLPSSVCALYTDWYMTYQLYFKPVWSAPGVPFPSAELASLPLPSPNLVRPMTTRKCACQCGEETAPDLHSTIPDGRVMPEDMADSFRRRTR